MSTAAQWAEQGRRLLLASDFAGAQGAFEQAIALEPHVGAHWALLGKSQAMRSGYHAAQNALEQACKLDPAAAYAHVWLGHALREQNQPDAAIAAFERASLLEPANVTAAFGAALVTPVVYRDETEIDRWRERVAQGLAQLAREAPSRPGWARSITNLEWSNFYLAYQGRNDRDLQAAYSDLIAKLLRHAVAQAQTSAASSTDRDRIHVAFVSSNLRRHTVTDYFGSWITDLPRARFRVSLYHAGGIVDERTNELRNAAESFEHIADDAPRLASALRAARPDIILYPDVGMSPIDTLLANMRLARVQAAAWGHPVTTGSRCIDAYFSCARMEPAEAQASYTENLVLLPGIGVNYRAHAAPRTADRSRFRLAADAHVYVCPQSLFKIHPATDRIFTEVLARDDKAVLVFMASAAKGQMDAFVARVTAAMRRRGIAMRNQLKFLPTLPRPNFLDLLAVCDVMLDPLHWSGGNTALDAISVGLPIVTLPGEQMRGRQSAAMLELLGLRDLLVAADESDYVGKASRIAGNAEYRGAMSSRVREASPRVFGRTEPVAAFAAALERLHQSPRP